MARAPSAAEQDYLKQIYQLQEETGRATTQELATRLGVKPSSVTAMLKHLAADPAGPYVRHIPYRGVELTDRGLAMALEILRHHRLIELFLAELLGMPWDQVRAEAERLEHVLSEELEERIAAKLGQPTHDPHGNPIPTREGVVPARDGIPLSVLAPGAPETTSKLASSPTRSPGTRPTSPRATRVRSPCPSACGGARHAYRAAASLMEAPHSPGGSGSGDQLAVSGRGAAGAVEVA